MADILHTVTNPEDNMTAEVFESYHGGFGVALRDNDSGLVVPCTTHRIPTLEAAIEEAKRVANVK